MKKNTTTRLWCKLKRSLSSIAPLHCLKRMTIGSYVGGLADSCGRKKLCLCYCIVYTFSVLMNHCKYFYTLMFVRVSGNVATGLLYSCFESWLICAHGVRGLEERWLAKSLSVSMYGSSLVAIGSGILANFVVERSGDMRPLFGAVDDGSSALYIGGYISAFDVCIVPLVMCAIIIAFSWEENFGEDTSTLSQDEIFEECTDDDKYSIESQGIETTNAQLTEELETPLLNCEQQRKKQRVSAFVKGMYTVWESPDILICCIASSVFEGAICSFIFLWTPTLTSLQEKNDDTDVMTRIGSKELNDPHGDSDLPLGWIFSSFMASCMLGSITFSYLSNGVSAGSCLVGVFALAAISCLVIACPATFGSGASSLAKSPQYFGMLLYEFSVGF